MIQNRNRLIDLENKLMITKEESMGWGEINYEFKINIYTQLYIKQMNSKTYYIAQELYLISYGNL